MLFNKLFLIAIFVAVSESKRFHSVMVVYPNQKYATFNLYVPGICGPFRINIRRVEKCPPGMEDEGHSEWRYRLLQRRMSSADTLLLDAECMTPFDINDTVSAHATLASWSNMGGWKENAHVFHLDKVCTQAAKYPSVKEFVISLIYSSIGEKLFLCPYAAGHYRVTSNWTVKLPELPLKYFFYGRWRFTAKLILQSGKTGACGRMLVDTVPI